jgi:DNA-binding NarL/FixJ family response regulator
MEAFAMIHPLSLREREILGLLAEGWTNQEIGSRLTVSGKTVGVHIGNILTKLDVPSRAAAAVAWARGDVPPAIDPRQMTLFRVRGRAL